MHAAEQRRTDSGSASGAKLDDDHSGATTSLLQFISPRFWPTWILIAWLRLNAALPWKFTIKLHKLFGRGLWAISPKKRHVVLRNLSICFPELSHAEINEIGRKNLENIGACLVELGVAWFTSPARIEKLFQFEGREHIDAAIANGKGLILLSGHFTTLEICVPVVKSLVPSFAFMFRPRRNALLNVIQTRCRQKAAHTSFTSSNVRAMVRMLQENGTTWYAPDRFTDGSKVELLPFFGEPALTSTATARIARASGAALVPFFFCRLPDDSGYRLRFEPALENFPTSDTTADAIRLNKILERHVRECPDQYFWTHRKFKNRPGDLADVYRQPQ
jgi:KDO2-lipid IV(A) lauroyltransferase